MAGQKLQYLRYNNLPTQTESSIRDGQGRIIADTYLTSIPVATKAVLGGIKVGSGLSINEEGVLSLSITIPTKVSELQNDLKFIDNTTDSLTNYYKTTETYSKQEIDNAISAIPKFSTLVVDILPSENISDTTVYLIPTDSSDTSLYDEYIFIKQEDGSYKSELLGTAKVNLDNYLTIENAANIYATVESVNGLSEQLQTLTSNVITNTNDISNLISGTTAAGNATKLDSQPASYYTPTNYYWANVPISSASSTTTAPTFGSVTMGNSTMQYDTANDCLSVTFN